MGRWPIGRADRHWYVDFVARWYLPLLGAAPFRATDTERAARLDRAFAEVYRLRRRVTTEADRLDVVAMVLGESAAEWSVRPMSVAAAGRFDAEGAVRRLVRRARRRQLMVSALVVMPLALLALVEVWARR